MARSTVGPKGRGIDEVPLIVDTESHVTEQVSDLIPYIDDRYDGARRFIEQSNDPVHDSLFHKSHAMPGLTSDVDADAREGGGATRDLFTKTTRTPGVKLEQMAEFGIDYSVCNPSLHNALNTVENTRFAVAIANGYNSWVLDAFLDDHDELVGSIVAPVKQRPDLAAEEIDDRGDEDDVVALTLPSSGLVPPPGNYQYEPVWEAASDNGLVVQMHGGNSATMYGFPLQRMFSETNIEGHAITHPFSHMWNLVSMIVHGVPERYPDLEFVIQEAGIAWLPYWEWRLDDEYLARQDQAPHLTKLPSEYLGDQFRISTQPLGHTGSNPEHLAQIIDMIGTDRVMFATDVPHPDFDTPHELFDRIEPHFDEAEVDAMMGGNAAELYGLG